MGVSSECDSRSVNSEIWRDKCLVQQSTCTSVTPNKYLGQSMRRTSVHSKDTIATGT